MIFQKVLLFLKYKITKSLCTDNAGILHFVHWFSVIDFSIRMQITGIWSSKLYILLFYLYTSRVLDRIYAICQFHL